MKNDPTISQVEAKEQVRQVLSQNINETKEASNHLYLYLCDPLKRLLLICNYATSSINQYMSYRHPSNITFHVILDSKKTFKIFYLIHIISILNSVFIVVF
jgi:hypothetical protein